MEKITERLGVSLDPFDTFQMSTTSSIQLLFYGAVRFKPSKAPSRRTGFIFRDPEFDMGQATPTIQKPRLTTNKTFFPAYALDVT